MPALRTLVHLRRARIQAAVSTHAHACTFLSRFLSSGATTCKHNADLHPGSRCGLAAKLPCSHAPLAREQEHAQSSHIHIGEASSKSNSQGTAPQPILNLIGMTDHEDHAVQHTWDARDSGNTGTCTSQIRPRGKGKKKPELLELRHRNVSVIKACEQVSPAGAAALRKPTALKSTTSEHLAAVLKVLEEFLGSSERASQALAASPLILYQGTELLEQKLMLLANFGVREEVFRKICTTRCILSRKLELLHSTLIVLEEVGLSAKARNRILSMHFRITPRTGMTLLRALDFFKSLGMSEKQVSKVMERRPSMIMQSVQSLMGIYTFFRQLGLGAKEFRRAWAGLPTVAIATLEERVKFLKDQGFSGSDVHALIANQPGILGLRCDYLKEKLDFLLREQKYETADIVRCPSCLVLSLQGRLIPRLTAVKERGLFKVYALSTILCCKEAAFKKLGTRGKGMQTRAGCC